MDIDALAAEIEGAGAAKEQKGKKKKKGAKKEEFEYDTEPSPDCFSDCCGFCVTVSVLLLQRG